MSAADVKKEEPKTPVAAAEKPAGNAGPSPSGSRGGGRGGGGGPMRGGRGGFQRGGQGGGGHPYQRGGGRGGGGPQRGRAKIFKPLNLNLHESYPKKVLLDIPIQGLDYNIFAHCFSAKRCLENLNTL